MSIFSCLCGKKKSKTHKGRISNKVPDVEIVDHVPAKVVHKDVEPKCGIPKDVHQDDEKEAPKKEDGHMSFLATYKKPFIGLGYVSGATL
ncbi:hypothetical protein LIER_15981 [Lithospermum erythrorhizon]|uniref:Uncharacterized protein n=1 Tax=Lithospermum erythrorhizon TaxID=34254 RepID=A0AAV3Q6D8_LITER